MSVPPVAEEADSVVAVAANELILLTIAASHCTLESWWSVTWHVGLGHCATGGTDIINRNEL